MRAGFFTDTSVCIGCKACEVACKEWNAIPEDGLDFTGMSYDNTGRLDANSWRHVAFIEQPRRLGHHEAGLSTTELPVAVTEAAADRVPVSLGLPESAPPSGRAQPARGFDDQASPARSGPSAGARGEHAPRDAVGSTDGRVTPVRDMDFRWLMSSDVCKHCTHAACLDVCPTGALTRTEFDTVVVQEDVCNGCGYCVPACPYGVIDQRRGDGRVFKCTMCYDRLGVGQEPACAKSCPTDSIQFGELDELRERAARRVAQLHEAGVTSARLYGHDLDDGVGGTAAFFLLLDEPEVYGLPPDPVVTTRDLPAMWKRAGIAALALLAGIAAATLGGRS